MVVREPSVAERRKEVLQRLKLYARPSKGGAFLLHAVPRNLPGTWEPGMDGIDPPELLTAYEAALDRTYRTLVDEGWEPPHPHPDGKGIPVYVFNIADYFNGRSSPFTESPRDATNRALSKIYLRSALPPSSRAAARTQAEIDATHETAHLFTHRHRPVWDPQKDDPWEWFDEGTAVYLERRLCRQENEGSLYGLYWVSRPEVGLRERIWPASYMAGWFVDYLAREVGFDLIRDVWHQAASVAGPITALDALLRTRKGITFADALVAYSLEAYPAQTFDRDVWHRHGERALAAWLDCRPGQDCGQRGKLGPLACRYYRLDVPPGSGGVRVRLRGPVPPENHHLRATLLAFPADGGACGLREPLVAQPTSATTFETLQLGTMTFPSRNVDHVILAIVNTPPTREDGPQDLYATQLFDFQADLIP